MEGCSSCRSWSCPNRLLRKAGGSGYEGTAMMRRLARSAAVYLTAAVTYFAVAMAAAVVLVQPAAAQKRVALIVGNSAYANAGTLVNPANDANDMAAALKDLGIEVILGLDLDKRAFDTKVRDFARALSNVDTGIFF